tara:strand:- start:808 stop:1206 length:399 start_codon:yes stop_codon:yes gene_type:complete
MKLIFYIFFIYILTSVSSFSFSVEPNEFLTNQKDELRARIISKNIRCLVCQNQSIDDSTAPLAKDLRIIIRNKITQGNNDQEIYDYLTDRYGDFILLKPPYNKQTILLWLLPFILLCLGVFIIYRHNKKSMN